MSRRKVEAIECWAVVWEPGSFSVVKAHRAAELRRTGHRVVKLEHNPRAARLIRAALKWDEEIGTDGEEAAADRLVLAAAAYRKGAK